jgi:hypothetical protein
VGWGWEWVEVGRGAWVRGMPREGQAWGWVKVRALGRHVGLRAMIRGTTLEGQARRDGGVVIIRT